MGLLYTTLYLHTVYIYIHTYNTYIYDVLYNIPLFKRFHFELVQIISYESIGTYIRVYCKITLLNRTVGTGR